MTTLSEKKKIHSIFEISIILKGVHSIVEICGGILTLLISKTYLTNMVLAITQEEISEDPKDSIAHYLITASNNFSVGSQHFIALYLLLHGITKLVLVIGLQQKKMWAYPLSISVFGLFILYQLNRFYYNHSLWLVLLTLFDIALIWLTLQEYRFKKESLH
jgi:uncharacterized membrane protein